MAWLYGDTFDGYQTAQLTASYASVVGTVTIDTAHGQCGSQSLKVIETPTTGWVVRGLTSSGVRIIGGVAIYAPEANIGVFQYQWGPTPIFVLRRAVDGSLVGYYNPDAAFPPISFVTPGGLVPASRLTYLEWDILLGSAGTGTAAISIDGSERYSATGLNTAFPGEAQPPTGFTLGGTASGTPTVYFDTLYLQDGSGSAPWNARLGHLGGHALLATGAGANTDFSVTGVASNYLVSSVNTPDATKYISSTTLNAKDSYVYSDIPLIAGTEVFCVQTRILAKEDAAGSREVDALVRQGGSDYLSGDPQAVPTTDYGYLVFPMPTNPATSAQWAVNDVNSDQFGVQVTT